MFCSHVVGSHVFCSQKWLPMFSCLLALEFYYMCLCMWCVRMQVAIGPNIQAPELLTALFDQGAQLLLDSLPTLLQGKGMETATPQDAAAATHAAKVSSMHARVTTHHAHVDAPIQKCVWPQWRSHAEVHA